MAKNPLKTALLSTALLITALLPSAVAVAGEPKGEEHPAPPKAVTATDHYVSSWVRLPSFSATRLGDEHESVTIAPSKGRLLVIVFLASWCEPCQQLMPQIQRLERHYQKLNTDFVYIFSHDTRDDAQGFMKEFKLSNAYLANQELLKTYHEPELPSIYVGDRHGWMLQRYIKTTVTDLAKLNGLLLYLAAY
ncbi:MAG: TlpA disulfide reductase family protein [Proteobacteria bacterium]|nr:TlpA disulfide reductase family protein [Pseudomonadota bacterium]